MRILKWKLAKYTLSALVLIPKLLAGIKGLMPVIITFLISFTIGMGMKVLENKKSIV